MPKNAATIIQNAAPGPPMVMAIATPAMLPRPTVADRAVVRASKCVVSPESLGSSNLPRTMSMECPKPLMLINPR